MDCERLKIFLKDRGISTTGYNKAELLKLAKCAAEISVEIDPDSLNANAFGQIRECLKAINFPVENPFTLKFTNDLSVAPKVGLLDIFNFLIEKRSDFDKKATKAYKSIEDYRLFYDGHVLELKCCSQPQTCCFYARVRPTQRQKTYMLRDSYEAWIITDHDGNILLAFCQCPAGVDGACRHVAAALYAVEDHETKSVTDGPAVWVRRNTTCEVADKLQNLPVLQARYNNRNIRRLPTLDNFDPRADEDRIHTAEKEALFAEMLRKEVPHATVLECFSDGGEAVVSEGKQHDLEQFTVAATGRDMTLQWDLEHDFQHFLNCLPSDEGSLQLIEQETRGQSDCPQWMELRKGRITASEMKRVCTRDNTLQANPDTNCDKLVQHIIIGKNTEFDTDALAWGRKKEKKARAHYCGIEKKITKI